MSTFISHKVVYCAYILEHPARCRSHDAYLLHARRRFVYLPHEGKESTTIHKDSALAETRWATLVPPVRPSVCRQDESIRPRRRRQLLRTFKAVSYFSAISGVRETHQKGTYLISSVKNMNVIQRVGVGKVTFRKQRRY